jgi:hypothetical protein
MIVFPRCSQEFASLLGVKKLSCFAFAIADPLNAAINSAGDSAAQSDGSDIVLEGQIDALTELLLQRASTV